MGNFSMVIECNFEGNLWVIFLYLNVIYNDFEFDLFDFIFCVWLVFYDFYQKLWTLAFVDQSKSRPAKEIQGKFLSCNA